MKPRNLFQHGQRNPIYGRVCAIQGMGLLTLLPMLPMPAGQCTEERTCSYTKPLYCLEVRDRQRKRVPGIAVPISGFRVGGDSPVETVSGRRLQAEGQACTVRLTFFWPILHPHQAASRRCRGHHHHPARGPPRPFAFRCCPHASPCPPIPPPPPGRPPWQAA
ncbi:hypothetical protein BGX38DRAFT_729175 [Terfezia claveryi]|nr:hypothetical protein BGX38DRAFT_729175 [Terfezia claveryi]